MFSPFCAPSLLINRFRYTLGRQLPKFMNKLLTPPTFEDLLRLLRAWRLWLLGALLGGLLGMAVYALFPPEYRARATIVVDFNAEQAWPVDTDKELFYYLEREARKLEEVAWADDTLQKVTEETGFSVLELRTAKLELSQPRDGAWHFYASHPDSVLAVKLASAWAEAFAAQTRAGIQTALELDAVRKALEANPTDEALKTALARLQAQSLGITPELQISPAQVQNLPVSRKTGLGTYMLTGMIIFWVASSLLVLIFPRKIHAA